mmetsp:Transcript_81247/g.242085  ORF Transcript_81247/g.242085 Transcript_81247/m.242085 type:complete len:253 (-) Transcript_81247:246-1004(-)
MAPPPKGSATKGRLQLCGCGESAEPASLGLACCNIHCSASWDLPLMKFQDGRAVGAEGAVALAACLGTLLPDELAVLVDAVGMAVDCLGAVLPEELGVLQEESGIVASCLRISARRAVRPSSSQTARRPLAFDASAPSRSHPAACSRKEGNSKAVASRNTSHWASSVNGWEREATAGATPYTWFRTATRASGCETPRISSSIGSEATSSALPVAVGARAFAEEEVLDPPRKVKGAGTDSGATSLRRWMPWRM